VQVEELRDLRVQARPLVLAPAWTIPNWLSLSRLVIALPLVLALLRGTTLGDRVALSLMAWAALSDILDGHLARRTESTSRLGAILDPVADKILIGSIVVTLVFVRSLPAWIAGLVVTRDLAILIFGAWVLREKRVVLESTPLGKAAGVVFSLTIVFYTLRIHPASVIFAYGSVAFVVASSVAYFSRLLRLIQGRNQ
jgi:CDP-diacylglycerol--glycerol-3-phosphate 3-phosphatidyltransferase